MDLYKACVRGRLHCDTVYCCSKGHCHRTTDINCPRLSLSRLTDQQCYAIYGFFLFFFFDWWTILLSFLFCELWLILWIWCMDDVAWSVNTLISWLCTVYQGVPTLSEVISDLEGWRSYVTNYRQSLGWCIDFNPFREEQSSLGLHCLGGEINHTVWPCLISNTRLGLRTIYRICVFCTNEATVQLLAWFFFIFSQHITTWKAKRRAPYVFC